MINNIRPVSRKYNLLVICCFACFVHCFAQTKQVTLNRYGLEVINDSKLYRQLLRAGKASALFPLAQLPGIQTALRYAGTDNFTGKLLYRDGAAAYLITPAAIALRKVLDELKEKGLGLLVWDAYRPYSVTEMIWKEVKDERYAANPAKGSGHNRGLSIDCTLYDLQTGVPLEMPTDFDDFSEKAHHSFQGLTATVLRNRKTLLEAMEKNGFKSLSTEWWHYSFPNTGNFPLLDIPFKKLP
ncbi:MAG: M15 family metallopeptidase [Chitinophagaceae bacterium]